MKDLVFNLNIGYEVDGAYIKEIELLRSNSIAEEVFTKKIPEKPYSWIANVLSVAVKRIGNVLIGESVRAEYLKNKSVTVPSALKKMPLADANSLLLEIHRRVWQSNIPKQKILCSFCAKTMVTDIDLDKIELQEQYKAVVESNQEFRTIICDLAYGFQLDDICSKREHLNHLVGSTFKRLVFRIPTIGDALTNEQYSDKSLEFWRRIALDCLLAAQVVNDEGKSVDDLEAENIRFLGLNFFSHLDSADLKIIRSSLREELPTMPFAYEEECPCDMKRTIPYAMEASAFFSE